MDPCAWPTEALQHGSLVKGVYDSRNVARLYPTTVPVGGSDSAKYTTGAVQLYLVRQTGLKSLTVPEITPRLQIGMER